MAIEIRGSDRLSHLLNRGSNTPNRDNGNDFLATGASQNKLIGGVGNGTLVLKSNTGSDSALDFQFEKDSLVVESGLQSGQLIFDGQTIRAGDEVLANLNVVDGDNITISDMDIAM